MNREPLSARELFWTTFLMMFPTILLLLPGDLLRYAGRYAWWTPLVAGVPACALSWIVGALAARYGDAGTAFVRALGPVAGRIPIAAVLASLAVYTTVATREYAQVAFSTFVFEDVPLWLLTMLGLMIAGMAAWLGLTVIGRGSEIMAPLLIWVHLFLFALALPFSHFIWARPILPRNPQFATLPPVALTWVWLVEPLAVPFMLSEVAADARRRAGPILAGASGLAAAITAVGLWVMVADFGPARASSLVLPMFNLAKEMTFGSFLQHLEVLLIPVALMGGAGKLAIFYWLLTRIGTNLTGGSGRVWLLASLALVGAASVWVFSNILAVGQVLRVLVTPWAMPVLVGGVLAGYLATAAGHKRRSGA